MKLINEHNAKSPQAAALASAVKSAVGELSRILGGTFQTAAGGLRDSQDMKQDLQATSKYELNG